MSSTARSQDEVDYYWEKLSAGRGPKAQQCGWLKDKYGLSWQIVPTVLGKLLSDPDPEKSRTGDESNASDEENRHRSVKAGVGKGRRPESLIRGVSGAKGPGFEPRISRHDIKEGLSVILRPSFCV